jgi:deoxyribose-phosphate aldolase
LQFLYTFKNNSVYLMKIAGYLDHTLLAPNATENDIRRLCQEGRELQVMSVCVGGTWVKLCAAALEGSNVRVAAAIGFPHGNTTSSSKCFEAETCFRNGADELDMVINIGWLSEGQTKRIEKELSLIRRAVPGAVLKLILETCYLNDTQKRKACQLALREGWDYVKTSTGFGPAGATLEDVRLMRSEVGKTMGVKASGGIRDYVTARKYLQAGATRIGTSSGPGIVRGEQLSSKDKGT